MCGIAGVFDLNRNSDRDLVDESIRLLRGIKNRGQEGYGLSVLTDKGEITTYKFRQDINSGELYDAIRNELGKIKDKILGIICHAWYPTSGSNGGEDYDSIQPYKLTPSQTQENINEASLIKVDKLESGHAFAFNGNIPNAPELARMIQENYGINFKDPLLDTRVLQEMMLKDARKGLSSLDISLNIHNQIDGSCNMILMSKDGSFTLSKDRWGFRPLSFVEEKDEDTKERLFYFSSESSALSKLGFDENDIKKLNTGESVNYNRKTNTLFPPALMALDKPIQKSRCFFETVYFSDSKSKLWGTLSSMHRFRMGQYLATNDHNRFLNSSNAVVIDVPASSHDSADGYANKLNLALFSTAITKNPFFDKRAFIGATKEERLRILENKYIFNPNLKPLLKGKELIIVDDSIVRGTTLEFLIQKIKDEYEPSEIHIRIPSPPIIGPCYYAINLKHPKELIARRFFEDPRHPESHEMYTLAEYFGVETINYLNVEQLIDAMKVDIKDMCLGCVTGDYPTPKGREIFAEQLKEETESKAEKTPA